MKVKVLFVQGDVADYLGSSILHGLLSMENVELTDYPKAEIAYKPFKDKLQKKIRGGGFSLFFKEEDSDRNRFHLYYDELQTGYFDLIIFSDINAHFGLFIEYLPFLSFNNTAILDGSDSPALYPYSGFFWRKPYYWFLPRAHKRFRYFKREMQPDTLFYRFFKILPRVICKRLSYPKNILPISFSIPEEKIIKSLPVKKKLFPKHIVDEEIAAKVEGSFTKYAFENEKDYYNDMAESKFGITTKRSGWDCLRHYEIAANGTLICFRDLDKKPDTCAPHGLIPGKNCISYKNYHDLTKIINSLSDKDYNNLQYNCWEWAKNNTTIKRSQQLLKQIDTI